MLASLGGYVPTALMAKAKTSQGNAYPPLVGVDDQWGSRQAERKQGRAKMPRSNPRSCGNASDARSTYATAYSSFVEKTANLVMERNTTVRTCGAISTRRTFLFMFHQRLLAAPSTRQNFEGAPLFFCRIARFSRTRRNHRPCVSKEQQNHWAQQRNQAE